MKKIPFYSGFTLLELMIVVLIIGIIAGIAVVSYSQYMYSSRRTDGTNALLSLALQQEQYRTNNSAYGSLAQIGGSATSSNGYYNLAVTPNGAIGYTLTANATTLRGQGNDKQGSVSCSTLTLTVSNGTQTKSPAACWAN